MTMFLPQGNRILIRPDEVKKTTASGLAIPEIARGQERFKSGIIVSMGPGMLIVKGPRSGERWPMPNGERPDVLPDMHGKRGLYFAGEGAITPLIINDVTHHIIADDSLDAYVNDVGEVVPLYNRVLVRRAKTVDRTAGGIWIPDTAQTRPVEGDVLAVGTGRITFTGAVCKLDVTRGDRILFGKYSGTDLEHNGKALLIVREDEILGVAEGVSDETLARALVDSQPAMGAA